MSEIRILDACCGSRMFWFDKAEPHTTYMDRRGFETIRNNTALKH